MVAIGLQDVFEGMLLKSKLLEEGLLCVSQQSPQATLEAGFPKVGAETGGCLVFALFVAAHKGSSGSSRKIRIIKKYVWIF